MADERYYDCAMCGSRDWAPERVKVCLACRTYPRRLREGVARLTLARRKGFVSPTGFEPRPDLVWKKAWEWEQRLEKEFGIATN